MADDSKSIRARSRHLDDSTISGLHAFASRLVSEHDISSISKPTASGIGIEVEPAVESSIDYDSDGDVDMGAVKSTASVSVPTKEPSIDFDSYLPVFILAHGELPRYTEACRSGDDPLNAINKIKEDGSNMFIKIPDNMIMIDPTTQGLYCFDVGRTTDTIFPEIIQRFGNNNFLKERYSRRYNDYSDNHKSTIGGKFGDEKERNRTILQELYTKTKLYYPGDDMNNYYTAFTDYEPYLEKYSIFTINQTWAGPVKKYIAPEWTLLFNNKDADMGCVYLEDVFKKLRKHFGEDQKLMIYLISCRGTTSPYRFKKAGRMDLYYKTILKQEEIERQGIENINKLRPIKFTGRQTRRQDQLTTSIEPKEYDDMIRYYKDIEIAKRLKKQGKLSGGKRKTRKRKNKHKKSKRKNLKIKKRKTKKRKTNKRKTTNKKYKK